MLIKVALANIKHKKFRTFLIIFSIALSTALIYSTLAISSTSVDFFEKNLKKSTGNAEIIVSQDRNSNTPFFVLDLSEETIFDFSYGRISFYGKSHLKDNDVKETQLIGMSLDAFTNLYGFSPNEQGEGDFSRKKAIIGATSAKELDLGINDTIDITINGQKDVYTLWAIVDDSTNFLTYNQQFLNILIPLDEAQYVLGLDLEVKHYFVKTSNTISIENGLTYLKELYPNLTINKAFEEDDVRNMMNTIIMPLFFMVLAVCLVSCFIIYSSFKVIVIERFPLIGTLRSIGATRRNTRKALYFEGLSYSILGGIIGNLLGIGILTLIMQALITTGGAPITNIHIPYHIISFLFAIILTFVSALVPIIKTSKMSIKDVIFSTFNNEKHFSSHKVLIASLLFLITFILFIFPLKGLELIFYGIGFILFIIGATFVIPLVSFLLTRCLALMLKPFLGNEVDVAESNIRHDKTVMNNIILLAIGLGVIFLVNNLSSNISKEVIYFYDTAKFDAMVGSSNLTESLVSDIESIEGIEKVIRSYEHGNIQVENKDFVIPYIIGISGKEYSENTWDEFTQVFTDSLQETFQTERSIIVTNFQAKTNNIKLGDVLTLSFDHGPKDYKVIAIVDSIMNNGAPYYIYDKFFQDDILINPSYLYLITDRDIDEIKDIIAEISPINYTWCTSLEDLKISNQVSNDTMFVLIKSFSIIAMIIGIVGIFNNYMVSFMSRKKTIAVLRSLGLSKRKMRKLFLIETLFCGITGSLMAILLGVVLNEYFLTKLLAAMSLPSFNQHYSAIDFAFVFVSGILISLISSLTPSIKTTKSSIINDLRYE